MKYSFFVVTTGEKKVFDTKEQANAALADIKQAYLLSESYRFSIAKEIVDGSNTVWTSADLENDPENGVYQVFNHSTGLYEAVNSLQQAKNRTEELKNIFWSSYAENAIFEDVEQDNIPVTKI